METCRDNFDITITEFRIKIVLSYFGQIKLFRLYRNKDPYFFKYFIPMYNYYIVEITGIKNFINTEFGQWFKQDGLALLNYYGYIPSPGERWESKHFKKLLLEIILEPKLIGCKNINDDFHRNCCAMLINFSDLVSSNFENYNPMFLSDEWFSTIKRTDVALIFFFIIETMIDFNKILNFNKLKQDFYNKENNSHIIYFSCNCKTPHVNKIPIKQEKSEHYKKLEKEIIDIINNSIKK